MKLKSLFIITGIVSLSAQAQVVLDDQSFFVLDNEAKVVLDDKRPEAITLTETGGYILSKEEGNEIIWNIADGKGGYKVPFAKKATE